MKILKTIFLLFTTVSFAAAQDVITLHSGEEINAKITEVNIDDIKYKKTDYLEGPTYSVQKSEVFMVKYANGSKDVFTKTEPGNIPVTGTQPGLTGNVFLKGQMDAEKYYTRHSAAGAGTFVTTLVVGIFGVIPAVACASTTPKERNLGYPNADYMKNPDYYNGYTQGARKKKSRKVWGNFGIAVGINIVAYLILTSDNN